MTVIESEQPGEADQAADAAVMSVNEVEGEIREFVRRDISVFRRSRTDGGDGAADNVNAVIQRVADGSVTEIERVIEELGNVRDMLRHESDRVQREISGYASLSQAAMTSMKIIADSLAHWKARTPKVRQGGG
jgi:hypothetical protein